MSTLRFHFHQDAPQGKENLPLRADARERRERIIITTCALYRTHHHDSLTLDQIAEEAGVGIATLYRNFPDRYALDMACAGYLFEKVIDLQLEALSHFDSNPRAIWLNFNLALAEKGLGSLVPALAPESLDDLPDEISKLRRTTESHTHKLIALAISHGIVHPSITAGAYIVGLITVSRPPVHAIDSISPASGSTLLGLFLSGLEHGSWFEH